MKSTSTTLPKRCVLTDFGNEPTYLRVDGGDGVELGVVVEGLGEPPDGRLLALPLQPAVQHPLAAPLQTPAALALDLK